MTGQRLAILKVVTREENRHLSATEIYEIVKDEHPGIGLATVYKNLHMMEQKGILSNIELPDKTSHYEISDEKSVHCHLICSKCGKITEIRGAQVRRALELLRGENQFAFQQGSITFYGICEDCARLPEGSFVEPAGRKHPP